MSRTLHLSVWIGFATSIALSIFLLAQGFQPGNGLTRAIVTNITQKEVEDKPGIPGGWIQTLTVSTPKKEEITLDFGSEYQALQEEQLLTTNTEVILDTAEAEFRVLDRYRLPGIAALFGVFIVLVVSLTGKQGMLALLGMVLTFATLFGGLLPWILSGGDAMLGTTLWAIAITFVTTYLSHGWNRTSHLAVISILSVLGLVGLLAEANVTALGISGFGTEEALFLPIEGGKIPMQGLFLAGVILGVLGVLDDICLAQVALVEELAAAKPDIQFKELWQRSMRVGRTHVVSLVNTLILAYASANLPLFLLFLVDPQIPWWEAINHELFTEEIVRTLAGSIGLVLAVPVTSALAGFAIKHWKNIFGETNPSPSHDHHHHHHG